MRTESRRARIHGIKKRIQKEKNRERRIGMVLTIGILIAILSVSGFLANSMLTSPKTVTTSKPQAAIVDQLSLTQPNRTFIEAVTRILKQAGFIVDYFTGEEVTVEFYRDLATHEYSLLILRTHSTALAREGQYVTEAPVTLFTSEKYDSNKYVLEQLSDRLFIGSYPGPQTMECFAITPNFIASEMKGKFAKTAIIMMGCDGLKNTLMARVFIQKGAELYVGWTGPVRAGLTDHATTLVLRQLVLEKKTVHQALNYTATVIQPESESLLAYYPLNAGERKIEDFEEQ